MSVARESRWLGRRTILMAGGVAVSSYILMLFTGCIVGLFSGATVARDTGLPVRRFVLATVVLLGPALLGARLWYVLQHLDRYRAEPSRLLRRAEGGMALYGGLLLSLAASVPFLHWADLPLRTFWDVTTYTMLVGLVITRFGCLMNGCCAGRETSGPLGMWLPNHRGEWRRRYPTPLLEAGWGMTLLGVSLALPRVFAFPGARFASIATLYAAGRLVLQFTREAPEENRRVPADLILSGVILIAASAALALGLSR